MMDRKGHRRRAFTLVELLIVITIIGILAAVAIPQFSESSADAKIAALDHNLASLRSSIEVYQFQHTSAYPGVVKTHKTTAAGSGGAPAAAAPAGGTPAHASAAEAFVKPLPAYSDTMGNTCDEKNAGFPYGPYIKPTIPDNPLPAAGAAGDPDSVNVTTDTTPLSADGSPTTGWKFSSETGEIIANSADHESR